MVLTVLAAFTGMLPAQPSYAQESIFLPPPGQLINITRHFEPAQMVGLKINLKDPFSFGFIMDQGESRMSDADTKEEYNKIIKYFLVSLAMPNKDMWVNLSPYESKRIIPEVFGQTEMGRDLLAQDYILKQFTASLIYPESELGKKFWNKVYKQAQARFGTTDINVNTFNKVWIIADKADIYQKGDTAFLIGSHLKVMMEEDFMAIDKNQEQFGNVQALQEQYKDAKTKMASAIVREIVIPAIEKEVNEGKSFAAVRQIYSAEILATWFKKTLRKSLLGQVFANKSKIAGQKLNDPQADEKIYKQYLRAYKKGVFNFIKEDTAPDGQIIPRKYFSGGALPVGDAAVVTINKKRFLNNGQVAVVRNFAMITGRLKMIATQLAFVGTLFGLVGAQKPPVDPQGYHLFYDGAEQEKDVIDNLKIVSSSDGFNKPFVELSSNFEVRYADVTKHQQIFKQAWRFELVRPTVPDLNAQKRIKVIRDSWTGVLPEKEALSSFQAIAEEQDHSHPTGGGGSGGPNPWEKLTALLNPQGSQSLSPKESLVMTVIRSYFPYLPQNKKDDQVGGINLSDEHLTMNIKVDGQGMPIASLSQIKAIENLNGLTSIIRKISPVTPQNVPALFDLIK